MAVPAQDRDSSSAYVTDPAAKCNPSVYFNPAHCISSREIDTKSLRTAKSIARERPDARVGVATNLDQNNSGTSLSPRAAAMASGNSRQNASTHSLGTVVLILTKREPNLGV
jgi:hypothetical protein